RTYGRRKPLSTFSRSTLSSSSNFNNRIVISRFPYLNKATHIAVEYRALINFGKRRSCAKTYFSWCNLVGAYWKYICHCVRHGARNCARSTASANRRNYHGLVHEGFELHDDGVDGR